MGFRAPIKVWGVDLRVQVWVRGVELRVQVWVKSLGFRLRVRGVELRVQVWGLGRTEEGDVVVGLGGLVSEKLEPGTGEVG